ncbi:MAG: type II secretion system F family protein [Alphaproteobacteria bacterium]|nr:type II secretion system F family protein [Alphaproteobacteria bacterium]MBV9154189.1 type II secretion system F family protein [Alphaproteobacteria bacterium]
MMPALLDPVTLTALVIGMITAVGFLAVAAVVEGPGSRRLARRLDAVKGQKRGAASGDKETRSLSLRENVSKMDQVARRWLPRRDMLVARLERTGRNISIGKYMLITLILIVVLAIAAVIVGGQKALPSLLLAAGLGVGIPHMVIGRLGKRRVAAFINLFPDAIDLMVRALRSGLPISEAIIMASHEIGDPIGAEFRTIEAGMRLGRDLESLLWDIGKRILAPEFRFFIIALSVQRETGGNLAETLSNLSDVLRRRRTMRLKARAMASEARASTMILGSLPLLVSVILLMTSPNYIMPLFSDIRGLVLVGIALGMLGTGIGIMVKMAKFEI